MSEYVSPTLKAIRRTSSVFAGRHKMVTPITYSLKSMVPSPFYTELNTIKILQLVNVQIIILPFTVYKYRLLSHITTVLNVKRSMGNLQGNMLFEQQLKLFIQTSLTLSNSANSSSRAGLTGSLRKVANSAMVMRPPLQELAIAAKPSSSFFKLSHFRLRENEQSTRRKLCCVSVTLSQVNMDQSQDFIAPT